jgi:hypothetical protein
MKPASMWSCMWLWKRLRLGRILKSRCLDAETGEFAVEPIGDIGKDQNPAHNRELSPVTEFEYGVNKF